MNGRILQGLGGLVLGLLPMVAGATDLALVISNQSYRGQARLDVGAAAEGLAADLKKQGWSVFAAHDGTAEEMWQQALNLRRAMQRSPEPDRVIIAVTGLMAHGKSDGWLLADAAGEADMLNVGGRGLSLGALSSIAGFAPGHAVILIGTPGQAPDLGLGLEPGPGEVALDQGVSAVYGPMAALRGWATGALMTPDNSYDEAFRALPDGVRKAGFSSRAAGFAMAVPEGSAGPAGPMGEMAYWNAARDIGSAEAMQAYLDRFPNGVFAAEARAQIAGMAPPDPLAQAAAGEEALGLSRDARRQVQRNLDLLGYDPRGIDGVFGRGSRAAIGAWQGATGYEATGYLTAAQIGVLQRQADRRAAELEREAQLRREAEERADRQFWQQTGRDEASLRRYLERYPDGLFADDAQARLDLILQQQMAAAEARERAAWTQASDRNTVPAYREFLAKFPNGAFAPEAKKRIARLQAAAGNAGLIEQLKKTEAQVAPNQPARFMVEQALRARGQDPGQIDGTFDESTRRALRRFQREHGLPVSGYVNQKTMVVLMLGR